MPKLWSATIEAHRLEVAEAILDATATLVTQHGLLSVTMSQIAEKTGIGRATLYKYFADVEAILVAWHDRQISGHLRELIEARDSARDPIDRLAAVLETYALNSQRSHGHHDVEFSAFLHQDSRVARAREQLREMVRDLVAESATTGEVRSDVPADELTSYCLQALTAASTLRSKAAVKRLVSVTMTGLRPPALSG